MATISFTFPAQVADFLNLEVPGFAAASGGGNTVAVQVPSFALPSQVVSGLNDAGIQIAADAGSGASVAAPDGAAVGVAQFAPAGLVPQGAALEKPDLAGAAGVRGAHVSFRTTDSGSTFMRNPIGTHGQAGT